MTSGEITESGIVSSLSVPHQDDTKIHCFEGNGH